MTVRFPAAFAVALLPLVGQAAAPPRRPARRARTSPR